MPTGNTHCKRHLFNNDFINKSNDIELSTSSQKSKPAHYKNIPTIKILRLLICKNIIYLYIHNSGKIHLSSWSIIILILIS